MADDKVKMLSIDDILAVQDVQERVVEVPEWGGAVRIRGMTKARREVLVKRATLKHATQFQKAGELDAGYFEMLMLVESVVDPKLEIAHIPLLKEKSVAAIDRISRAVLDLNGLTGWLRGDLEETFSNGSGEDV